MSGAAKLSPADHALIHALTALITEPWGPLTDTELSDDRYRVILSQVLPRLSHRDDRLAPLADVAGRIVASRGPLGGLRHAPVAPLNDWNRQRMCAALTAMESKA